MPTIDFSDVPEIEPVPAGEYEGTIVFAQAGMSNSGNPKIDIRWETELVDESGVAQRRMIFDSISFHPNALWRAKATLKALGFPKNFSGEIEPEDLIDRAARLTVVIDSGRTDPATGDPYPDRNRVTKVAPSVQQVF